MPAALGVQKAKGKGKGQRLSHLPFSLPFSFSWRRLNSSAARYSSSSGNFASTLKRIAQADVLGSYEVQRRLTATQPVYDVAVHIFVNQQTKHQRHSLGP